MGLDISHNAWHGAYSSFNTWREEVAKAAGYPPLNDMKGFGGSTSWEPYKDNPLTILLDHSDCDGEIKWQDCILLADALIDILLKLPDDDSLFRRSHRDDAKQFIAGLMASYEAKEDLEFR